MRAAGIASALGGRKVGRDWVARCPAHADRVPSLSISVGNSGKVLIHCHAGCTQERVIQALRACGLWLPGRQQVRAIKKPATPTLRAAKCTELALRIWASASPADGTLVETYLASRGIRLQLPPTLRFHPSLRHPSAVALPAMVSLVTDAQGSHLGCIALSSRPTAARRRSSRSA